MVLGRKNRCKTIQKHFTEYDISSLYVRYNFHYAVSCTRFPAVRYCTNMGQMLFLTCFRLVFCALGSFRYGGFIIDLYRFVSILCRFCIDFSSIFVVGFRGQMQAVISTTRTSSRPRRGPGWSWLVVARKQQLSSSRLQRFAEREARPWICSATVQYGTALVLVGYFWFLGNRKRT